MPLVRRIPKGGFTPLRRTRYQVVNLASLASVEKGADLSPKDFAEKGWIRDAEGLVKILGDGDLPHAVKVSAHKFSKNAIEKIEKAGGAAKILATPGSSHLDSGEAKAAGSEK
jgi:large subunit ribosomal protein L15